MRHKMFHVNCFSLLKICAFAADFEGFLQRSACHAYGIFAVTGKHVFVTNIACLRH
jgi:hypothetical protein